MRRTYRVVSVGTSEAKEVVARTAPNSAVKRNNEMHHFRNLTKMVSGTNERRLVDMKRKIRRFLTYVALLSAGIGLFVLCLPIATRIRGYNAVGGEYFLTIFPLVVYSCGKTLVECVKEA